MTVPADYTCALCPAAGMTEREAVLHECGVTPPEPTLADIPMSTREAVTVLANQLANITGAISDLGSIFLGLGEQIDNMNVALGTMAERLRDNDRHYPIYIEMDKN